MVSLTTKNYPLICIDPLAHTHAYTHVHTRTHTQTTNFIYKTITPVKISMIQHFVCLYEVGKKFREFIEAKSELAQSQTDPILIF